MRPLRALAHAYVSATVFMCALVAGAFLHLAAFPIAHRTVQAVANRALGSLFLGKITIDRIGFLGLTRVDGIDAHVDDPNGKPVLRIEGASARVSTLALLRSLGAASGPLLIGIPELSIAHADVHLDADESGTPRIARAFALRVPAKEGEPPGRGVLVALPRIHIAHALLQAQPSAPHDGDLDDADASLAFASGALSIDLSRARLLVRGLPEGVQAFGDTQAHLEKPSKGPLAVRATWDGSVGSIREHVQAALDGDELDVMADAGPATSKEIAAVWPEWPLAAAVGVHAEAHGRLPRLDISARVSADGGQVSVTGAVTVGPAVQAALHVEVSGLSGQMLLAPLSFTRAGGAGDVYATLKPSGDASVHLDFTLAEASWATERIAPTTVTGDFTRASDGKLALEAKLTMREPGAPAVLSLRLVPKGASATLSFEGYAGAAHLEDVSRLRGAVSGAAAVHVNGTLDWGANTIAARVLATAADLRVGGAMLRSARAEADVSGALRSPLAHVALEGEEASAGPIRISAFRSSADVTLDGGVALHDVDVSVAGDSAPARIRAAIVRPDRGGLRVDHAVVEGLGAPLEAAVRISKTAIVLQAKSAGIDLARLGSFASMPEQSGILAVDVDVTVDRESAEGRVALNLSQGEIEDFKNARASLEVKVHGRQIAGHATASTENLGSLDVKSSALEVGRGDLTTASPWRQAWGAMDVDAHADLARCFAHFVAGKEGRKPGAAIEGQLEVAVRLERDSPSDMTPEISLTARTTGLAISHEGPTNPWRFEGVEPELHAVVNGSTGATSVSFEVRDAAGRLATLQATSDAVPYASLLSDFSSEGLLAAVDAAPFAAFLEVQARPLASLPALLGTRGLRGTLSAKVDWHGTVLKPTIDVAATLTRGPADAKVVALPLDLALSAHYDGALVDAALFGSWHGSPMLDASARIDVDAGDVLAGLAGDVIPWTASARAKLTKLALRNFPVLDDRQVRGSVSGEVTLSGLHRDARASLALRFDDLQVGDVNCRLASATATADGRAFDGSLRIDDANGGQLQTRAHFGLHWGPALVPALDVSQAAQASVLAKAFRAALLLPFVSGTFTDLDGTLDGDARVTVDAAHNRATPEGTLSVKNGAFELTSMGGLFHGVAATMALSPDGVLRLENAVAYGTSGEVQASATGRLNGFALGAARATVQMPRAAPLPIVFDGVLLGTLDGRFDVALNRSSTGMDVDVQVPTMHLDLPAGPATRDVQALGGIDHVDIGFARGGEFVEAPLDGSRESEVAHGPDRSPTRISVKLGGDVQVTRGTDLNVLLEGQSVVVLGSDVQVTGQIRLVRGTLDVKGKAFDIERGTVSFVGSDPSNPQVVLTAGWAAPDGTHIYADFVGPLKTGKVTLRSEPSRSQNEILALLLFGTADDSDPSGMKQYSVGAQAGGAVATQPINQALGGLNRGLDKLGLEGGLSTKVDTSTPNPRPEVALQIARDISLQISWVLGNPPITNPDTTFVTLDWNFLRKWSLETTVGDQATSIVDIIWQHRY